MLSDQDAVTTNLTAKTLTNTNYTASTPYVNSNAKGGWKLSSGTLVANGTKAYDLRLWLDASAPSTIANQVFNSKIVVKARPTNQAS